MLTTDQKGAAAETAVIHAAIKLGLGVYIPMSDGERYDLIIDTGSRLLRVQCKWAPREGGALLVRTQSARRAREGFRWRSYGEDEIDAVAAYCPDLERCYYLPVSLVAGMRQIMLRVAPCKNNQRLGIHWAKFYEFGSIDWDTLDFGAIAQLGERRYGIPEVAGSSPASST